MIRWDAHEVLPQGKAVSERHPGELLVQVGEPLVEAELLARLGCRAMHLLPHPRIGVFLAVVTGDHDDRVLTGGLDHRSEPFVAHGHDRLVSALVPAAHEVGGRAIGTVDLPGVQEHQPGFRVGAHPRHHVISPYEWLDLVALSVIGVLETAQYAGLWNQWSGDLGVRLVAGHSERLGHRGHGVREAVPLEAPDSVPGRIAAGQHRGERRCRGGRGRDALAELSSRGCVAIEVRRGDVVAEDGIGSQGVDGQEQDVRRAQAILRGYSGVSAS